MVACLALAAAGAEPTPAQARRIEKLERSLVAPCCWSEPVATHRSEAALQMKVEIRRMVLEGKRDEEILGFYKQRYGMRVLLEPEGSRWWWLQVIPWVMLALGAAIAGLVLRRWLRPLPSS